VVTRRQAAVVTAALAGVMLLLSLRWTWHRQVWVESVDVMDGRDLLVRVIVLLGLVTGVLVVWGVFGGRNWAPLTLAGAWLLMVAEWLVVAFASVPSMERGSGMVLATLAMVVMTVAAALGRSASQARGNDRPTHEVEAIADRNGV
jgi:hypothetical protein